jgi:hypothetical protein
VREGWLLSEGEVVASAIELTSPLAALFPAHTKRAPDAASVLHPRGVVLIAGVRGRVSLLCVDARHEIKEIRPLRPWRLATVPRTTTMAAVLPSDAVERLGLATGHPLEFREAR